MLVLSHKTTSSLFWQVADITHRCVLVPRLFSVVPQTYSIRYIYRTKSLLGDLRAQRVNVCNRNQVAPSVSKSKNATESSFFWSTSVMRNIMTHQRF